jgi:DNA-binding IclR family transcriptional regulator
LFFYLKVHFIYDMLRRMKNSATSTLMTGPAARYRVPALARGLRILEFLAARGGGATAGEVASALSLPMPSVFRMLVTMVELGYVSRLSDGSTYRLSRKLLAVGYAAVDAQGLVEKSMDVLRRLRDATQETALLAVLSENEGIVLEQVAGSHPVTVLVQVGHRFPLHTAAPGKAILAYLPDDQRDALLKALTWRRYTERTLTTPSALLEELADVRRQEVAFDRGEELDDLRCVGAPVLDPSGYPLAAVWVSGPASRIKEADLRRFAGTVRQHARMLSERMFH